MKAMESSMVAIPADVLKEFPQTKMAPNPVSPVNMVSITNGTTTIPTTNGEAVVPKTEISFENGENGISQPSGGVKRKDNGKESRAPDLKKIRLCKDSDDEDDPDDPSPQVNGNKSDNDIENEIQKRLENIPEKSKEMEAAQTEAKNVLEEVSEALKPKVIKENSEYEKEEVKLKTKLRRLSRRELENMILKRLNEKILNQHEMGKLKQLSEKLEGTLESNRKKTAQFHKEIEDMKKVTHKLMQDHQARKGQYVAPIRIKRSVGIQATENIIKKGAMYTSNGTGPYKTIAPRPGVSKGPALTSHPNTPTPVTVQTQMVRTSTTHTLGTVKATTPSGTTQMLMVPAGQMVSVPRSAVTAISNASAVNNVGSGLVSVGSSRLIRAPIVAPQGSVIRASQQQMLIQQPSSTTVTASSTAITTTPATKTSTSSGVIDLTDEDEGNRARQAGNLLTTPGTVVKVPVSSTGTSLQPAILQTPGGSTPLLVVQQVSANGIPRGSAVLVSNVGTTVTTGLTTTLVSAANRLSSTASTVSKPTPATSATAAAAAAVATATTQVAGRHPAPLPRTPPQQQVGGMRNLPPQPTLKLSHKENSIVLSWTMSKTEEHESIASYQLYAYQEGTASPSSDLWKKVGSVKALELPMACTLTQFMPGHVYHFAVRAVDSKSRLGPFSEPRSIRLDR